MSTHRESGQLSGKSRLQTIVPSLWVWMPEITPLGLVDIISYLHTHAHSTALQMNHLPHTIILRMCLTNKSSFIVRQSIYTPYSHLQPNELNKLYQADFGKDHTEIITVCFISFGALRHHWISRSTKLCVIMPCCRTVPSHTGQSCLFVLRCIFMSHLCFDAVGWAAGRASGL